MWFDSHCHLHLCGEASEIDEVVTRARRAGVTQMLTVGIDPASNEQSVGLASRYGLRAAVGVHPNSCATWDDAMIRGVADLAASDVVAAIGESGLDFYRDSAPHFKQVQAFKAHIALAKRLDKALVIHTRDSLDEAIDVLTEVGPPERFVFHCWSGTPAQMNVAVDMGAAISFAGNVSFKNAQDLRDVAALVPHNRLLVETDSPFLSPEPHRGKPNEPRQVSFVGLAVAQARAVSVHALAEQTTQNALAIFS